MFDYHNATHEELVHHIVMSKVQSVSRMRLYYKNKGDYEMVERIDKARGDARIVKLEQRLLNLKTSRS